MQPGAKAPIGCAATGKSLTMTRDTKMNLIVSGLSAVVLGLMAYAIGLRIWTVGDIVRTTHSVQSGESTVTLSYSFVLFVVFTLVAIIAFANTWRRRHEPPDKLHKAKSGKGHRST
jgi:cytochrome bd-type quinol oxidase subunit 1